MTPVDDGIEVELREATHRRLSPGLDEVRLVTDSGVIDCRFHPAEEAVAGVVWVGGEEGGLEGPAGGMYPRLAGQFVDERIASLRLDYRHPGQLVACVLDTLLGIGWMEAAGIERIGLVGHSFGGAVAITAGALHDAVAAVAALSSQSAGTRLAAELAPTPLLLMHGSEDMVMPASGSQDIYRRAKAPKGLRMLSAGHDLDACRDEVDRALSEWLKKTLRHAAGR